MLSNRTRMMLRYTTIIPVRRKKTVQWDPRTAQYTVR